MWWTHWMTFLASRRAKQPCRGRLGCANGVSDWLLHTSVASSIVESPTGPSPAVALPLMTVNILKRESVPKRSALVTWKSISTVQLSFRRATAL
jgi:hypothetical protein